MRELEQKCIRPGLWHIEGYVAHCVGRHRGLWIVTLDGVIMHPFPFSSLNKACEWIANQLEQGQ